MKSFSEEHLSAPMSVPLSWRMGLVMESKGRQELYESQRPETLRTLREVAMIQSAESSNRIEGVTVEHARLKPLVLGKVQPRDRSEEEIVGYREALAWIHNDSNNIPMNTETLKQLHALAQGGFSGDAGEFKQIDNDIIEVQPSGIRSVRFQTVSVAETSMHVEQLCLAYQHSFNQHLLPPLLLVANTVFDFLCIHPFRDGNGRVSRLLTLLLLYHHDYRVGRYISLERIIEDTKESYYDALYQSSQGWHEAKHSLLPWWMYFLGLIHRSYQQFEQRVKEFSNVRGAKTEAVQKAVESLPVSFSIREIESLCPQVSREQIRNVLREYRDVGKIKRIEKGRGTRWEKSDSF